ncbi:MAG TPA: hypothetical protein DIT04_06420 [Dysgonomonas sp.]|nr:hypothetical protein [Dysgonomonas sp.]
MHKSILALLGIILFLGSCTNNKNVERLTVASDYGACVGVVPQKCLWIKAEGSDQWEFWYSDIEGFNYEPGYEYVLEVKRESVALPAADQSSIKYVLEKVISKTRKQSEGLPM